MASEALERIVERNQVWPRMAAKYGVENPLPPWKTSLDGLCDALDQAACDTAAPSFKERRDEEDVLSATRYADLPPYPREPTRLAGALADGSRPHHRTGAAAEALRHPGQARGLTATQTPFDLIFEAAT